MQSTPYSLAICLSAFTRTDTIDADGTSARSASSASGTANVSTNVSHSATLTCSRSATKSPSVRGANGGLILSGFGTSAARASRAIRISHQCSRTTPRPTLSTFATFRSASPRRTCSSNTISVLVSPLTSARLTHRRKLAIFTRRRTFTPPLRAFLEEETAMI
ncbi:MAG: hypothetical protein J0L73_18310 [Verrucomicrobia bacterium]|nr:hypothetical protein [Verrucomicrobiota bacterium]